MNFSVSHTGKRIHIPDELISIILSKHAKQYLGVDRLVCKTFCTLATPHMFDTAIVGSQEETLHHFEEFAEHEIFSKMIKTVVFVTCSLEEEYATVDDYHSNLLTSHWQSAANVPPLEQCEKHWQDYRKLSKEQAKLQQKGEDGSPSSDEIRIRKALRRMPNIKHLVISSYTPTAAHPFHKIWLPNNYTITHSQPSHGFNIMTSALLSNGIQLCSIMQAEERKLGGCLYNISAKIKETFRPLRKLTLTMQNVTALNEIANYLSVGTKLEHLEIDLRIWSSEQIKDSKVFHITWPSLRHLKLGFNIDYEPFLRFCKNHKKTLQSLHLEQVRLFGGSWEKLIKEMKEHLRLTSIRLENLDEHDDGLNFLWKTNKWDFRLREAENYVIHGGEDPFENEVWMLGDYSQ